MNHSTNKTGVSSNYLSFEYTEDYEDEICRKDEVIKFGSIAIPIFYTVVLILSFTGNILVIVILALYENLKSLTNAFILNLALSDLMFTLGLPFWACYLIWGWTSGEELCKAVSFVFSAGFYSSTLFLTLMTIQRYVAVVHPLTDRGGRGPCFTATTSILVWALSGSAAIPDLVHSKVMLDPEKKEERLHCEFDSTGMRHAFTYLQNIFFIVSFSVMGFCYVNILRVVLKSRTNKRHRTIRLIFTIVMVFFIGWAPYNIVLFLKTLSDQQVLGLNDCGVSNALDYALFACRVLAFSHCCLNPVFYAFVGVKFRNHLMVILNKLFPSPPGTDSLRDWPTVDGAGFKNTRHPDAGCLSFVLATLSVRL
ncbi:chemokine XC receptor 1-like [Chanos chanos]|uniref:Chemokine XC receptor 1-like n=1 Tax=Chanos chanos TaxID=29144 RepID=A0A6J2WE22_CHACN|nr:chemokine XC receptor 1-like [Chanos chanos]